MHLERNGFVKFEDRTTIESYIFLSFDFKIHKPAQVITSVMTKLKKNGKGIVLMHDFQRATALVCRDARQA